jgi:hypothetical protein
MPKPLSFGKVYGAMRVRVRYQPGVGPAHVIFEIEEVSHGLTTLALDADEARQLMEWLWRNVGAVPKPAEADV